MSNEVGDPPASRSIDRYESPEWICDRCGTPIDTSDWHPVATEPTPDGSIRFSSFCSEGCRGAWLEERRE